MLIMRLRSFKAEHLNPILSSYLLKEKVKGIENEKILSMLSKEKAQHPSLSILINQPTNQSTHNLSLLPPLRGMIPLSGTSTGAAGKAGPNLQAYYDRKAEEEAVAAAKQKAIEGDTGNWLENTCIKAFGSWCWFSRYFERKEEEVQEDI